MALCHYQSPDLANEQAYSAALQINIDTGSFTVTKPISSFNESIDRTIIWSEANLSGIQLQCPTEQGPQKPPVWNAGCARDVLPLEAIPPDPPVNIIVAADAGSVRLLGQAGPHLLQDLDHLPSAAFAKDLMTSVTFMPDVRARFTRHLRKVILILCGSGGMSVLLPYSVL